MRRLAMAVGAAAAVLLAACGSNQSTDQPAAPTTAQTITATVQLHLPLEANGKGTGCSIPRAAEGGFSSFNTGDDLMLQDENGVILARTKIPPGTLIKALDCQVDLTFADVSTEAKMYMLVDAENKGWKFMPAEVSAGTIDIDFLHNLPAPL